MLTGDTDFEQPTNIANAAKKKVAKMRLTIKPPDRIVKERINFYIVTCIIFFKYCQYVSS